ncbi:MAG TPA: hypothetical protein VGX03_07365 [Candidatus Binatia bacterium]|nr:hypothetical protein [Candidatus Binatia bacterium]
MYPQLITYRLETLRQWAAEAALQLVPIRWPHRNQTYFVAARRELDLGPVFDEPWRTFGIRLADSGDNPAQEMGPPSNGPWVQRRHPAEPGITPGTAKQVALIFEVVDKYVIPAARRR